MKNNALEKQVGGTHYKNYAIQPVEFFEKNDIPYIEANVIKYVVRWREKGGIESLDKAIHYIEMLKEMNKEPKPEADEMGELESSYSELQDELLCSQQDVLDLKEKCNENRRDIADLTGERRYLNTLLDRFRAATIALSCIAIAFFLYLISRI